MTKTYVDPRKVNLSEKEIEDWLWENPEILSMDRWLARQYPVPSGIIDLLGIYDGGAAISVIEIKNSEIDANALVQVCRYANDIEEITYRFRTKSFPYIYKICIGKGELTDKTLFEANSLEVEVRSFQVGLELDINGPWRWRKRKREEIDESYWQLSKDPIFSIFIESNEEEIESDVVKEAQRIIEEETDNDGQDQSEPMD